MSAAVNVPTPWLIRARQDGVVDRGGQQTLFVDDEREPAHQGDDALHRFAARDWGRHGHPPARDCCA